MRGIILTCCNHIQHPEDTVKVFMDTLNEELGGCTTGTAVINIQITGSTEYEELRRARAQKYLHEKLNMTGDAPAVTQMLLDFEDFLFGNDAGLYRVIQEKVAKMISQEGLGHVGHE
jgi:hypothetical protein